MMPRVEVIAVDPRDQTWEVDRPRYRVYFHDTNGASDEHEITGADVGEVIAWAETRRGPRTYVLYVCVDSDGLGLVRLAGADPNTSESSTETSSVLLVGSIEPDGDR